MSKAEHTSQEQRNIAISFCDDNLIECCSEILHWHKTGILHGDKLNKLKSLLEFAGHSAMPLAEEFVKIAAMKRITKTTVERDNLREVNKELLAALYSALPFVEDAITDPAFKPESVKRTLLAINAAISMAKGE